MIIRICKKFSYIFLIFIIILFSSCDSNDTISGKKIIDDFSIEESKVNDTDNFNDMESKYFDIDEDVSNDIDKILSYNTSKNILEKYFSYQIVLVGKDIDNNIIYLDGYEDLQDGKSYKILTPDYNKGYDINNIPSIVSIDNKIFTLVEGVDSSPLKINDLYNDDMKNGENVIKTILNRNTIINQNIIDYNISNTNDNKYLLSYHVEPDDENIFNNKYFKFNNIKGFIYNVILDENYFVDEVKVKAIDLDDIEYDVYTMKILYNINIPIAVKTVRNETYGEVVYYNYEDIENFNKYNNFKKFVNSLYITRECHREGVFDKKNWIIKYYFDIDGNIVVKDEYIDTDDPIYYIKYDGKWYEYRSKDNIKKLKNRLKKYENDPISYTLKYDSLFDHNLKILTSYEVGDNSSIILQQYKDKYYDNISRETIIDLDEYQVLNFKEYIGANNNELIDYITFETDIDEPNELIELYDYIDEMEYSDE